MLEMQLSRQEVQSGLRRPIRCTRKWKVLLLAYRSYGGTDGYELWIFRCRKKSMYSLEQNQSSSSVHIEMELEFGNVCSESWSPVISTTGICDDHVDMREAML